MNKGKIIAFEGIDGCGKTTQVKMIYDKLKEEGYNVHVPSRNKYCDFFSLEKLINSEDKSPELTAIIFAMDRWMTYINEWKEIYENGGIILCDRYILSNIVYSISVSNFELRLELGELEEFIFKIPLPDLNLIFKVPSVIVNSLLNRKGEEHGLDSFEKNLELQKQCAFLYNSFLEYKENGVIGIECYNNLQQRTKEDIFSELHALIKEII